MCGKGLVEPRFLNSIEGYIVADPFENPDYNEVKLQIFIRNYGVDKNTEVELKICDDVIAKMNFRLSTGEDTILEFYVKAKEKCEAKLIVNGVLLDTEILSKPRVELLETPSKIVMVFHHHQPPDYGPDNVYRFLWPFIYVWKPVLFPYGLGPYHYHAVLLKKYGGDVKFVYNISPSLIKQWLDITEKGIKTASSELIESTSSLAMLIKETLDVYKDLAKDRVIEVLTSIYAHTIAGYLVDSYNLEDIVKRELEFGLDISKNFVGTEPKGVWLPEMSFSMKLVPILKSLGIEYTFLDERYHLRSAEGDVKNHYELYEVQDISGNKLIIFFRDTELSDDIAFANNYCSDIHAIKGAYSFIKKLINKCINNKAKLLTVALDGENWMALSKNPPATAVFFRTMVSIFKRLNNLGLIKLVKADEAVRLVQPVRKLRNIPSTTWLGSYAKWRGEVVEHEKFWNIVEQRILKYKEYVSKHGLDDRAKKMEWALWHILDSDYWWAEYWNKEMINLWIAEFDKYAQQ